MATQKGQNLEPQSGEVYYHYKDPNKYYLVLHVGYQEEDQSPCVIYQALYGERKIWVRNVSVWCSKATTDAHPEGEARFVFVGYWDRKTWITTNDMPRITN
jgi:hypothetical protein